jgi:hypothetical protein
MPHPYDDSPLLVLSGVGRSGTFAVRDALGLHPRMHSTGTENNIIFDLLDAARRNRTIEARRVAMKVDDATYHRRFRELILNLLWPDPRPEPPLRLLAFTNLLPDRADELGRIFPGVRVVYLVRNGIEVVSSRLRFDSFAALPYAQHCRVWARSVEMGEWGRDRDDFLLVRHEHLLDADRLARVFAALWSFAGLPPEPRCADRLLSRCYHPTSDNGGGRPPGEVLHQRAHRWRDWTDEQRATFTEIAGDAMRSWGYAMPWVDAGERALAREPL